MFKPLSVISSCPLIHPSISQHLSKQQVCFCKSSQCLNRAMDTMSPLSCFLLSPFSATFSPTVTSPLPTLMPSLVCSQTSTAYTFFHHCHLSTPPVSTEKPMPTPPLHRDAAALLPFSCHLCEFELLKQ